MRLGVDAPVERRVTSQRKTQEMALNFNIRGGDRNTGYASPHNAKRRWE